MRIRTHPEKSRDNEKIRNDRGHCSLDDWDENRHNLFRGHQKSFFWVQEAVKNSLEAGLIVCVSLCPVKEFVTAENLNRYFLLAKNMGASFVRILEPRAIGRYSGKDVLLEPRQIKMIENFVITGNCDPAWSDYPIIVFSGYYQRKFGAVVQATGICLSIQTAIFMYALFAGILWVVYWKNRLILQ